MRFLKIKKSRRSLARCDIGRDLGFRRTPEPALSCIIKLGSKQESVDPRVPRHLGCHRTACTGSRSERRRGLQTTNLPGARDWCRVSPHRLHQCTNARKRSKNCNSLQLLGTFGEPSGRQSELSMSLQQHEIGLEACPPRRPRSPVAGVPENCNIEFRLLFNISGLGEWTVNRGPWFVDRCTSRRCTPHVEIPAGARYTGGHPLEKGPISLILSHFSARPA